ncbi:uncharacterized protein N7496_003059 [Penicillium cataractarum]|uniref:Uncharacterized protein n=1 Tax=Penicillium cataractarum TaxID=2100454 RepID=A0A9W9SL89_9EURO|nr:uncharacterized protein N7496_003059 [Penicillium cataractarum]KAJ5380631.1 hypothetical protein N7496_003059 [Penicillium cataractarum]
MSQLIPDWLRIILLLFSGASYLPQLHRIWVHRDCQGISLGNLLLTLITATEQLTLGFFFLVNNTQESDFFIENPPTTGDWLNLAQFTLVWALQLLLFILCLWFPSGSRVWYKLGLLAVYILFTSISLMPLFIDDINHEIFGPLDDPYRKWAEALFGGYHLLFLNPIVTIMALFAYSFQARAIRTLPAGDLKALSLRGLLTQGVMFVVVAISWTMRVKFASFGDVILYGAFWSWYQMVGWAAVDNAIFALGQIFLFVLARDWGTVKAADEEREPLLRVGL